MELPAEGSFTIIVKANQPRNEIVAARGKTIRVSVKEPAEDNRANIELLKFLKRKIGKDLKIIKGQKQKQKVIKILSK